MKKDVGTKSVLKYKHEYDEVEFKMLGKSGKNRHILIVDLDYMNKTGSQTVPPQNSFGTRIR